LFILLLIIEDQALGTYYLSWLYGLMLIFFGILYSVRFKLYQPAVIFCSAGITLWHYMLAAHYDTSLSMLHAIGIDISANPGNSPFTMMIWLINLIIFLILLPIFGPVVLKSFRLALSAKRIFNTAAQTVITTGNGFTGRPYVAGNSSAPEAQITGFVQYLSEQKLVYPKFIEPGVFLTFSMGKSPLANGEINGLSYFAFENNGKLTVHISQKDYKRFRKQLTFDKLCDSMAALFKRFFDYYANNQEARIITELQSP
jgi:hypothetical protein